MNKLRRLFTISVMVMTIVVMSGAVVTPTKAAAQAGDLIKMDGISAVYYLGDDGKRYVFPNESTYFSWYNDFSGVVTVSASELQSYMIGGNVVMRAGTNLVKITTDPTVYAVGPDGMLHSIVSEANAIDLYGPNWASMVVDVPDSFFTNYTIGSPLTLGMYPAGQLLKMEGSADVYYFDGSDYRMFGSEAAFLANGFSWDDVVTTDMSFSGSGSNITGFEADLFNPSQNGSGSTVVSAGSGLSVALSASTPASITVPSGATGVVMTKFNVTASNDGEVILQSLVVKRTGVGASSELTKVYVYDGDTRLSNGRSISSSSNTATFSNLNYTVPAGMTKTLSLVVDVIGDVTTPGTGDAVGNHALGIESASAITAGGSTVTGSFPVTGNIMSMSSTLVGKTDIENANSYTVKSGDSQVEVGRLAVYVNNTEDGQLESLTLYNSGRDILSNLRLYRGSDLVAYGTQNGSYYTFVLDTPYKITKGESAVFTVKSDITNARNADTATLYVRYNTDLKVKGLTYGYYLLPALAQGGDASNSAIDELDSSPMSQSITVEAGQVTVSSSGPVSSDVAKNSNDVVLMDFNISTVASVDVEKVGVILRDSDTSDDDDLSNLEIVCDGAIMNEWSDPGDATASVNTDTSVWNIPANSTMNCQIRVDIESTKGSDTISADWDYSNWTFKDANTGDTITDVIPSTDIAGQDMTVTEASLTLSQSNTPASQTWVSGAKFDAVGLNFAAGDAEDVKVTNLVLVAAYDNNDGTYGTAGSDETYNTKDVISSVEIYDGATKVGSTETVSSAGLVTFDNLNWTVPASANKVLTVKVQSSSNAPYGGNSDMIKFYVLSVTSEYGSGTSLAATITAIDTVAEATIVQTIASSGTITAVIDTDTPTSDLVLMGSTSEMTKVKFTTTNEAFVVEKLQVSNTSGTSDDAEYTSVTITYPTMTGTESKTQTFVGDTATFTGLNFYVAKDDDAILTLSGTFNSKTGGATNGVTTALDMASTGFRAVSQSSGTVDTTNSAVTGQDMYVYESVPTVAFASDTPSGNLIPNANALLAKIAVTADAAKSITFENADGNSFVLQVATSGAIMGNLTLKDGNGTTLDSGVTNSAGEYTFDFSTADFTVPAGTTKYLYVYGSTLGFSTAGNSVQTWLDDVNGDIDWGINGTGSYNHGDIIFKGELYGGALVKP